MVLPRALNLFYPDPRVTDGAEPEPGWFRSGLAAAGHLVVEAFGEDGHERASGCLRACLTDLGSFALVVEGAADVDGSGSRNLWG